MPDVQDHGQAVEDEQRSCRDKRRYPTDEIANAVAADCYELRGHWLRAYHCALCGGWHLTHTRALPPAGANWRPPAKSQRQLAAERKRRRR